MCYSVSDTATLSQKVLKYKPFKGDKEPSLFAYKSGYSHPELCIVKSLEPDYLTNARWGLVPCTISDASYAKKHSDFTLNADSEKFFETKSYKDIVRTQRCLIAATGIIEWRHLDNGKNKIPYLIGTKDEITTFGGLYDHWTDNKTGITTCTFSIVTLAAPEGSLMAKIHNNKKREPLILTKDIESEWLNINLNDKQIIELVQPISDDLLVAHTIKKFSPKDVSSEDLNILSSVEYPELAFYD